MSAVRIKVGASLDVNTSTLMKPFIDLAAKARAAIQAELAKTDSGGALKKGTDGGIKSLAQLEKEASKVADKMAADFERSFRSIASNAATNFRAVVNAGARIGGGILRGTGVNFDIGTNVGAALQGRSAARTLANKGYQEGAEGAAGVRQDPKVLYKEAAAAADDTAHSINEMLAAQTAFVENSGDLELARKMIGDIGKMSNATGAEMKTLAEVAGKLDLKLQSTVKSAADRQDIINKTMRVFAAQGKTGAIDIEQLAPQIPKLIAGAGKLAGGETEAFQTAGIAAQISAAAGGAASPAQAAQSVNSLINAMSKTKNGMLGGKGGVGTGISIPTFADEGHTKLRNPLEVMAEMVSATKGDFAKMNQLVPNVRAMPVATALQSVYTKAGGGASGDEAMRAEIEKYKKAVMSAAEVERANAEAKEDELAKGRVFQNQLEKVAGSLAERVLPELEKLAPVALEIANAFGNIVAWAAENPGQAIVAAIVASLAKAAIGEVVSAAITNMLKAAGGSMGGAGGIISAAIGSAAVSISIAEALITVQSMSEQKGRKASDDTFRDVDQDVREAQRYTSHGQALPPELRERLAKEQTDLAGRTAAASVANPQASWFAKYGERLATGKTAEDQGTEYRDKEALASLQREMAMIRAELAADRTVVKQVRVVNPPNAPPGGTSGPPAPTGG